MKTISRIFTVLTVLVNILNLVLLVGVVTVGYKTIKRVADMDLINTVMEFETKLETFDIDEFKNDIVSEVVLEMKNFDSIDDEALEDLQNNPVIVPEVIEPPVVEEPVQLELIADPKDVTKVSNATAEELNAAIKATCKWMYEYNANMGEVYQKLEEEHGINAYFALAVSFSEVGVGDMSKLAREDNNTYGLMNGKKYDTVEDCVDYFFRLIKKNYVGEGRLTVEDIAEKYCLGNPTWIKNVTIFMNKLPGRSR